MRRLNILQEPSAPLAEEISDASSLTSNVHYYPDTY